MEQNSFTNSTESTTMSPASESVTASDSAPAPPPTIGTTAVTGQQVCTMQFGAYYNLWLINSTKAGAKLPLRGRHSAVQWTLRSSNRR